MPNNSSKPKPTLALRNFQFVQIRHIHHQIKTAVDNQDTFFCIQKAESDIERLLLDAHESTTYLIDNVPQDTTAEQIMNDFMDLQDESYAVMRLLKETQLQHTTTTGSNSPSTSTAVPPNPQLSPQVITG